MNNKVFFFFLINLISMSCIYFLGNRIIGFFLLFFLSVRLFD